MWTGDGKYCRTVHLLLCQTYTEVLERININSTSPFSLASTTRSCATPSSTHLSTAASDSRCFHGFIVVEGESCTMKVVWEGRRPAQMPTTLTHSLSDSNISNSNLNNYGTATSYGLHDREVGVRVPVGSRIFSSPKRPDRL
jgi:hypothetical protein